MHDRLHDTDVDNKNWPSSFLLALEIVIGSLDAVLFNGHFLHSKWLTFIRQSAAVSEDPPETHVYSLKK